MTRFRRWWPLLLLASVVFNVTCGPALIAANVYLWGVVAQLMAQR